MKQIIQSLKVGDYVWNVCGLAPIVEITGRGTSEVDGMDYICFTTRFSKDSTISGSIRENRAVIKDGYIVDNTILQFIPNHIPADFITD